MPASTTIPTRPLPTAVRELLAAERADGWYEFRQGEKVRCPGVRRISDHVPEGRCCDPFLEVLPGKVIRVRVDMGDLADSIRRASLGARVCHLCRTPLLIATELKQDSAA